MCALCVSVTKFSYTPEPTQTHIYYTPFLCGTRAHTHTPTHVALTHKHTYTPHTPTHVALTRGTTHTLDDTHAHTRTGTHTHTHPHTHTQHGATHAALTHKHTYHTHLHKLHSHAVQHTRWTTHVALTRGTTHTLAHTHTHGDDLPHHARAPSSSVLMCSVPWTL